jgi:hypothetical protein
MSVADFTFAPTNNRRPSADLMGYFAANRETPKGSPDKQCGIHFRFSAKITEQLGWVKGDRVVVHWNIRDSALSFVRVGVDDPAPAYKVSFSESKGRRKGKTTVAAVRINCHLSMFDVILQSKERCTFSYFETVGNRSVFIRQ